MSKCLHLMVLSSTLVRTGNSPIFPVGLETVIFKIERIKLHLHSWICDDSIPPIGLYLGKLALEGLQCIQDYTNRQFHIKQTTMPLLVMSTTILPCVDFSFC